jgi:hypothetical protein
MSPALKQCLPVNLSLQPLLVWENDVVQSEKTARSSKEAKRRIGKTPNRRGIGEASKLLFYVQDEVKKLLQ